MEQNQIINEIINQVRTDILRNKEFLSSIFEKYQVNESNIDPNLILKLMSELSATQQLARPKNNAPKDIVKGKRVAAKPIVVGEGSQASQIISDLLEGNNVYLVGKAGTGKTYLAKGIAESAMGQPTYLINCSQWTSPIEIRGGQTIEGYKEGELIKAWANGGVLILDELPKLDPNTAGLLNDALAETASQPKYDEEGKVIPNTIPFIVNGRGEKIYKGQDVNSKRLKDQYAKLVEENNKKDKDQKETLISEDEYVNQQMDLKFRFCVIGTGNTDMMNVGNKYGGNQRQDYSLVDRFAGSFYYLEANPIQEMKLTYPYVFSVCDALRKFLDKRDATQSISLRTMLNFNRTFEQQYLYKLSSPFADKIYDNDGNVIEPKTIEDTIESFLGMLEKNLRNDLETKNEGEWGQYAEQFREARKKQVTNEEFVRQFVEKYHLNPKTGKTEMPKEKK